MSGIQSSDLLSTASNSNNSFKGIIGGLLQGRIIFDNQKQLWYSCWIDNI